MNAIQDLSLVQWLALGHAFVTAFMAGLIWTIQLVHYPLFAWVPPDAFTGADTTNQPNGRGYEREHMRRITWVVAPAMLVELASAIALLAMAPAELRLELGVALGALALIWISTITTQGPLHVRLARTADADLISKLVTTNWLRTALWSGRAVFAVLLIPAMV